MLLINVPYSEKDQAKALGARWDGEKRSWYVPDHLSQTEFARWFVPEPIVVELFVDLVPRSAWFSNLRSELTVAEWAACKTMIFRRAHYVCEACGGRGPEHPVECHERWEYDDRTGIQRLVGLVAFCPSCHEATHYGSARIKGRSREAKAHLMAVNQWSSEIAADHIENAFQDWLRRSEREWALDATWLLTCGIELSPETKSKINEHASMLREREIQDWQKDVRILHAPETATKDPLAHYFSDDY